MQACDVERGYFFLCALLFAGCKASQLQAVGRCMEGTLKSLQPPGVAMVFQHDRNMAPTDVTLLGYPAFARKVRAR